MSRKVRLGWGLVVVAGLVSCRAHEAFCSDIECTTSNAGGAAVGGLGAVDSGAGGNDAAGGAGDGRAPCASDRECDDGAPCNGEEACVEGTCELGEPFECPLAAMTCENEAPGLCVFESPSPWLLFGTGATLEGLPTSAIGVSSPLVLERQSSERALGLLGAFFSKRGDVALSVVAERESLVRLRYSRFGPGLPQPPRSLPEVPDLTMAYFGPWLAPDSSYALVLDEYAGAFLAPLSDASTATIHLRPPEFAIIEAEFCEEAPSFWYLADEGTVSIATPTAGAVVARQTLGDGLPKFSREQRFVVESLRQEPDVESPQPGVVVSRCSAQEATTVFEGASEPLIGPGSQTLLLRYEDETKVFSLEEPDQQMELWSSHGRPLDRPAFSADGRRVVGSIDDVLHVATLSSGAAPVPFGLPEGVELEWVWAAGGFASLVGDAALVAYLPEEHEQGRALVWQALSPEQAPQVLLPASETSEVELLVSQHDVNELFLAVRGDAGAEKLMRVRLDTEQPNLEELFSLAGDITSVERAPDGSGLAVLAGAEALTASLWWVPLTPGDQVGSPFVLSSDVYSFSFQRGP